MRRIATLAALGLLSVLALPQRGYGQERPTVVSSPLNGTWKATFTDSISSGTTYMTLEVRAGGSVSGSYKGGTITGRLDGETFQFTVTQTAEGCPGSYSGSLVLQNDRGIGSYTGSDCAGEHENGVISMVRATEEEIAGIVESPVPARQKPDWARDPDPTPDRIRLLVRGDDFGLTHSSNRAMEQAFATGVMRSASVPSTAPWFAETAALIRSHPKWVVGLHLTISSGEDRLRIGPTLPPDEVPSLVAPDGYFFHSYPGMPLSLEILREPPYLFGDDEEMPAPTLARRRQLTSSKVPAPAEVEAELRSQIRRARRLGVRIDYLDCHMGGACLPVLRPVLIRLAAELGVPIPERGWMGDSNVHFRVRGGVNADRATRQLADRLRSLRPGLHRLVVHPLVDSREHRAVGYFGLKSAQEGQALLKALASDEVQAVIAEKSIELVSVRDLWDYDEYRLKK